MSTDQIDYEMARGALGCPCCPEFSTYSKAKLHDHFGTDECPFWERVFNGEVYVRDGE